MKIVTRYRERLLFHPESGKIAADSLVIQNSEGLVVYFFQSRNTRLVKLSRMNHSPS